MQCPIHANWSDWLVGKARDTLREILPDRTPRPVLNVPHLRSRRLFHDKERLKSLLPDVLVRTLR